jgi:DNA (cytosine-5)-methyltransferase 1
MLWPENTVPPESIRSARGVRKRISIDLFAGAGGLSCGLEMAGFHPVLANEWIDAYANTYAVNHPDAKTLKCDIRSVDAGLVKELVAKHGEIDLVAGGPPCQGFSVNAPIRSLDDQRNHLFKELIRIVDAIRPKAVLIENVPGIVSLGKGTVVEQIYRRLNDLGYAVKHRILFAGHYGVPQMRYRTIFIGIRNPQAEIEFPFPQFNATGVANFTSAKELCFQLSPEEFSKLDNFTTVWEAISDLPELLGGERDSEYAYLKDPDNSFQTKMRRGSTSITSHICNKLSSINIERLNHIPQGGSWRDIPFDLLPQGLKRARRSDHTKRYGRLALDGLCSTVLTKCDPHWGCFFHPTQPRVISVREAARIQSFPDWYRFTGNMTEQYAQVGNAVPCLMARQIGRTIQKLLEENE